MLRVQVGVLGAEDFVLGLELLEVLTLLLLRLLSINIIGVHQSAPIIPAIFLHGVERLIGL